MLKLKTKIFFQLPNWTGTTTKTRGN